MDLDNKTCGAKLKKGEKKEKNSFSDRILLEIECISLKKEICEKN